MARLQKTALQETWDVRDIALAAGANLSDLVGWPVDSRDFPKGTIMDQAHKEGLVGGAEEDMENHNLMMR